MNIESELGIKIALAFLLAEEIGETALSGLPKFWAASLFQNKAKYAE